MFQKPTKPSKPPTAATASTSNGTLNDYPAPPANDKGVDAEPEIARKIRADFGFDPDDPNVKVRVLSYGDLGDANSLGMGSIFSHIFGEDEAPPAQEPMGVEQMQGAPERRVSDQHEAVMNIGFEVVEEVFRAVKKHPSQTSPYEGYAVLLEEVDELWAEIKADRGRQASARKEAIQVAAMAIRYILDLDPK